jgi:hypothetical protein
MHKSGGIGIGLIEKMYINQVGLGLARLKQHPKIGLDWGWAN